MNNSKIKYHLLLVLFLLISNSLKAQDYKRTAWWYFGDKAGLHFTDTSVEADTLSQIYALEGSATISDTNGNLLFYTNGLTVWNKNHQVMDSGTDIRGEATSTQTALIIPQPNNDSIFYIFTTYAVRPADEWGGLFYSIVNINTNNGLGKVISKNNLLIAPICEKVTATKHANGSDIWIMTQGFPYNNFYAYLLTPDGINECPIINQIGYNTGSVGADAQGMMKFSPDGKYISSILDGQNMAEIFNFNNATGKLTEFNYIFNLFFPYGVEFSPNSKNIYVTDRGKNLYQFDLASNNFDTTGKSIHSSIGFDKDQIQMGLDGKLYVAVHDSIFISVIENPNADLKNSNYRHLKVDLKGIPKGVNRRRSTDGLPNFVTSYFHRPKIDFSYTQNCFSNTLVFKEKTFIASYTTSSPSHTFNDAGLYNIQLIINETDTTEKQVTIESKIFNDNLYVSCNQNSFILHIPDNFRCINWSNGSHTQDTLIKQEGVYKVSAYNTQGCYINDSLIVKFSTINKPNAYQIEDSLFTDSSAFNYTWYYNNSSLNTHNSSLKINDTGIYYLKTENQLGCSNFSDIILIDCSNTLKPNIRKEEDTLFSDTIAENYTWYRNNEQLLMINYKLKITDTGMYYLKIRNNFDCAEYSDTLEVSCNHYLPNIKRIGNTDSLLTDSIALKYTWYFNNSEIPNSNYQKIKIYQNGLYKVITEQKYQCKTSSVNFNVGYLSVNYLETSSIKIFPNPTSNEILIKGIEEKTQLELYDIAGKKLLEKYIDKNEFTISLLDLENGIYLLKINNQTFKIFKK